MNSSTSFSSPEVHEQDGYRALSILAVASVLSGLVSVVSLAHPAAWIVPALSLVIAIVAWVRIQRQPDSMSGRRVALVGMSLSLFFAAAGPARYYSQRAILSRQARDFAQQFLEAMSEGDLNRAHQAALHLSRRQPRGTLLDEHYENSVEDRIDRDNYFSDDLEHTISKFEPGFLVKFEKNHYMYYDRGDWFINQRFHLYRPGESKPFFHVQTEVLRNTGEGEIYLRLIGLARPSDVDRAAAMRRLR